MENAAFPFYMVLLRDKISWQHFTFTSVPIYLITSDCTRVNTDIWSSLILCIDFSIYLSFPHWTLKFKVKIILYIKKKKQYKLNSALLILMKFL